MESFITDEDLEQTDPSFMERMTHFAQVEVPQDEQTHLDDETRYLAILATLLGCQGTEQFRIELDRALDAGVSPVQAKEVVYQAVDYLGIGRVRPFLTTTNKVLEARGVQLPLPDQSTTTMDNRLERGADVQVAYFGEHMRENWKNGSIERWLAANCFGDYYTRNGLTDQQRELATFCYLSAQGGCEPQLNAHALANMNLGNTADFLRKVVAQCLPYIGYPRSLNAIRVVGEAETTFNGMQQRGQ